MWLAAMQQPDFRTLNDFRGVRMKAFMDELFETIIGRLIVDHYITMENYFLDGTKVEASAGKYSFVWKKSTLRFEEKLKQNIQETLHQIHAITDQWTEETNVEQRKAIRKKRSTLKQSLKQIREDFLPRLVKYDTQKACFGERNSYSKTDPDATFMRMKEDPMKNGQLKPGYNVQLAASTLPMPKAVIAGAGYGSEENYLYALGGEKEPSFEFLIPYGSYMKEKTKRYKKDIRHASNWTYEALDDRFICPNGRVVRFKNYQTKKSRSGLEQSFKIYECEECSDCPLKSACTKAKGNRQVHWNTIGEELKAKAKAALEDDEKSAIYARRKVEVESVFCHIKGNRLFRRFSLRGLEKVHVEFGIVALAHNLLKMAGIRLATVLQKQAHKNAGRKTLRFLAQHFIWGLFGQFFFCAIL